MKVEVEIPDEDAEWLKENWKVDPQKLAQSIVLKSIQMGKEAAMAAKQGIQLTPTGVFNAALKVGAELKEETTKEEKPVG